jgi:hypothetical protein
MALPTATKPVIDYSEFQSDEFEGVVTSRPHCQVRNDAGDQGLLIPNEVVDRVEFKKDGFPPHSFKTKKGVKIEGILIQNPRILVLHAGDLVCTLPDGTKTGWNEVYRDNKKVDKSTKYLLFFLSPTNELLHQEPLQLNAGGVFSTKFAKTYKTFKAEFQKIWTQLSKDSKPRSQAFFSLAVFDFQTTHEIIGKGDDVNACCVIKSFVHPTPDNINDGSLFVGFNKETKAFILEAYKANEGYGTLAQEIERASQRTATPSPKPTTADRGSLVGGSSADFDELVDSTSGSDEDF